MRLFAAAAGLALVALGAFTAHVGDGPCWRGPDLNGISTEKGWQAKWPAEGPKLLWKASVGIGFSSFSVSEGRVYTMGNSNETDWVSCLDANTGKKVDRKSTRLNSSHLG